MIARWLISRAVRQAIEVRREIRTDINFRRDILTLEALGELDLAVAELDLAIRGAGEASVVKARVVNLRDVAARHLPPHPRHSSRENIKVVLIAVVIAMAIRTFGLQPFKIPTGSMQPTLNGMIYEDLRRREDVTIPSWPRRWFEKCIMGITYYHVKARVDAVLQHVEPMSHFLGLIPRQRLTIGGEVHTLWFPPETIILPGLRPGRQFQRGDDVIKLRLISGDHLFVDRLSYNFRHPRRGEVIVFETRSLELMARDQRDQYYIKRLVALGGDKIQIGNNRHIKINGEELDASTPRFENVYSFQGVPREGQYSGHMHNRHRPGIAPLFPSERKVVDVRPGHVMVFGDNTLGSYDSRSWGDFPQENIVGKAFFVYWPYSERFGFGHR